LLVGRIVWLNGPIGLTVVKVPRPGPLTVSFLIQMDRWACNLRVR